MGEKERKQIRQTIMGFQKVESDLVGDGRILTFIRVYLGHQRILSRGMTLFHLRGYSGFCIEDQVQVGEAGTSNRRCSWDADQASSSPEMGTTEHEKRLLWPPEFPNSLTLVV